MKMSDKNFFKVYTGKRFYITVNKIDAADLPDQDESIKKRLMSMLSHEQADIHNDVVSELRPIDNTCMSEYNKKSGSVIVWNQFLLP